MAVDPDDREGRAQPEPLVQRRRGIAGEADAGTHAHRVRERVGPVVEARDRAPLLGGRRAQTGERPVEARVAVLVDERREHARQRHDRIGDRAADHARVLRTVERAQLDVGRREAAQ